MAMISGLYHPIRTLCGRRENWRLKVKLVRMWNMTPVAKEGKDRGNNPEAACDQICAFSGGGGGLQEDLKSFWNPNKGTVPVSWRRNNIYPLSQLEAELCRASFLLVALIGEMFENQGAFHFVFRMRRTRFY
ncbi:hypothetical protein SESBI_44436 [Sesbania bispinosa]|nr:hypothetical protein SESBI_44436 [Sesbania bispinosa]